MTRILARGLAATIAASAVLLLACTVLALVLLDGSGAPINWVSHTAWPYLSVMAFILAGLMPFATVAIYAYRAEQTGVLGLVGLVMSLIGFVTYLGFQFDMAFVWPVLAARASELVDFSGPMFRDPTFAFVHFWMGPTHSIGVLLLGIALVRGRSFPRTTSVLFTIGVILSTGVLFPPHLIRVAGAVLAAPAMLWMASALWRQAGLESAAAPADPSHRRAREE